MKLNESINIQPPPYSDNAGNIVQPQKIELNDIQLIITDNENSKTLYVQIFGLPITIILWSGDEYSQLGDWTRNQIENRLKEKMGDNPSVFLRSLYPKTLEENPNHPGTVLSKMIKSLGIKMTDSCSCKRHALQMNDLGNDWCEQNIDTIVGWLRQEANNRKLPFIDSIGKIFVARAIKKSRKLLLNEPVPENDEDLDKIE